MINIGFLKASIAARDIVREVGFDFRYVPMDADRPCREQTCRNWHISDSGEKIPGCIVGTILHKLGVPLENMGMHSDISSVRIDLREVGIAEISDKAYDFLKLMQVMQDKGATWHSAYNTALCLLDGELILKTLSSTDGQ